MGALTAWFALYYLLAILLGWVSVGALLGLVAIIKSCHDGLIRQGRLRWYLAWVYIPAGMIGGLWSLIKVRDWWGDV